MKYPSLKELRELLAGQRTTMAEPIGLGDMMVEGGEIVEPEGYYPPALPPPPDYGTERFRERARQLAERRAHAQDDGESYAMRGARVLSENTMRGIDALPTEYAVSGARAMADNARRGVDAMSPGNAMRGLEAMSPENTLRGVRALHPKYGISYLMDKAGSVPIDAPEISEFPADFRMSGAEAGLKTLIETPLRGARFGVESLTGISPDLPPHGAGIETLADLTPVRQYQRANAALNEGLSYLSDAQDPTTFRDKAERQAEFDSPRVMRTPLGNRAEMVEAPEAAGVAPEMVEAPPVKRAEIPFSVADQLPKTAAAPFSPLAPKNESLGDPAIGTPVKDAAFDTVSISEYSPEVVSEAVNVAQGDSVATSPEVQALADRLKRRAAGRIPSITQVEGEAPMVSFQPEYIEPEDGTGALVEAGFDRDEVKQARKNKALAEYNANVQSDIQGQEINRAIGRARDTAASGKLKVANIQIGPNGANVTLMNPEDLPSARDAADMEARQEAKAYSVMADLADKSNKEKRDFVGSTFHQIYKGATETEAPTREQLNADLFLKSVLNGDFGGHKNTVVLQKAIRDNIRLLADVDDHMVSVLLKNLEDIGAIPRYEGE